MCVLNKNMAIWTKGCNIIILKRRALISAGRQQCEGVICSQDQLCLYGTYSFILPVLAKLLSHIKLLSQIKKGLVVTL